MAKYRYLVADLLTCSVTDCQRPVHGHGFCGTHYQRWRKHGDPGTAEMRRVRRYDRGTTCSVDGCDRQARAKGMCALHWHRTRDKGDAGPAGRIRGKDGDGWIVDGYRIMQRNRRRQGEHRFVMEAVLGRHLRGDETVHHINGDRLDNRPENLELWTSSHPKGQRVADKVAWAREILDRYGQV